MKNLFLSILTVLLGAIVISSCEKLKTEGPVSGFQYDTNSQINYSNITNHDISAYRGGSGCGEILVFDDMETFKHALSELERQVEEYDDAFVAHYSDMDEEELFEKEQEINYSEYKPMADFENYLDFHSSNADYLVAEAQYLDGDMNEEDDPELLFIGDEEERSLLNACNEVMVNDTIYKLTEDGYFVISDGNFRMLAQLDDFDNLPENVSFVGTNNASSMRVLDCKTAYKKGDYKKVGTKKIKWLVKKTNYPWVLGCYITAKTISFKKKRRRGWRRYRTKTKVHLSGEEKLSCDHPAYSFDVGEKSKNRRRSVRQKYPVLSGVVVENGKVQAEHYGAGGITYSSTLSW